jgi:drug/metabolite transporter (DMT)-like permease
MKKAVFYGVISSLFFAITFICNRSMNLAGGYWLWSATLRYIFTLPILFLFVQRTKSLDKILKEIKKDLFRWILWSTVGFGLFYMPLTMSSLYGASWFIASSWQIVIVTGILIAPVFGKKIPIKNLLISFIILVGILLLQISNMKSTNGGFLISSFLLVLIAAISYPLGNRKMMEICENRISTIERVFGMTICSMPFWIIMGGISYVKVGIPSNWQIFQSFFVALFSGVIATLFFFHATNLVKHNIKQLAVVEATQAGEVLFTLLGGIILLEDSAPNLVGIIGILIIVLGMITNSLVTE